MATALANVVGIGLAAVLVAFPVAHSRLPPPSRSATWPYVALVTVLLSRVGRHLGSKVANIVAMAGFFRSWSPYLGLLSADPVSSSDER